MFNFIYYGNYGSWAFYPKTTTGAQFIDLTEDGIKKYILPEIKENGYTQVVSMQDTYGGEFKKQFLKMQKQDAVQVCEIKEEYPEDGYTLTYFVLVTGMQYDVEYDEQDLTFNIFAFQDFHDIDNTDELPV